MTGGRIAPRPAVAAAVLAGCLVSAGATAAADRREAAPHLALESVEDGKCFILSPGGKLRVMRNTHPDRAVKYRLDRYFADKVQAGGPVGTIAPGAEPVKLGCTEVDGREQRWEIQRAEFTDLPAEPAAP